MQPLPPPETDEERKARQLATLRLLTEAGTNLAMAAAGLAAAEFAAPDPEPDQPQARPPARRDYHAIFNRCATTVRQLIALEAKIAADGFARPARPNSARSDTARPDAARTSNGARPNVAARIALATDPRRQLLRRALEHSVADREIRRIIHDRIDQDLLADPDAALSPATLLVDICDDFKLKIDFARLPDEILDALADGVDADSPPSPQTGPPEHA